MIPKYGRVLADAHGREGDVMLATAGGMAGAIQEAPPSSRIASVVREAQPGLIKVVNGQGIQGCYPGHPVRHRGDGLDKEGGSRPQGKCLAPIHPHGLMQYGGDAHLALLLGG